MMRNKEIQQNQQLLPHGLVYIIIIPSAVATFNVISPSLANLSRDGGGGHEISDQPYPPKTVVHPLYSRRSLAEWGPCKFLQSRRRV